MATARPKPIPPPKPPPSPSPTRPPLAGIVQTMPARMHFNEIGAYVNAKCGAGVADGALPDPGWTYGVGEVLVEMLNQGYERSKRASKDPKKIIYNRN